MKIHKSWLLPATCTIILAVTTYATATTTQATRQRQAEVKLQQVAVDSPSRPLKYGDKITKKIPNQEVLLLPTSSSLEKLANNLPAAEKHNLTRNRTRFSVEQQKQDRNKANVQISRRLDIISQENQFHIQHDVPIIQKNRELINAPISTTVGQQRTPITNKSRNVNASKQIQQQQPQHHQPTQYYNLNSEPERNIATTKTSHKSRQRIPTITTTKTPTIPATTLNTYQIPLSSHNSNGRSHHPTGNNNSTIVRHYHSNQRNKNHNINSSNSQPLFTSSSSSNAVAAHALQTKTESSSNTRKQTGNISNNQSVSSNTTNNFRSHVRKFTSNASTITIISSTSTSTTTTTTISPEDE